MGFFFKRKKKKQGKIEKCLNEVWMDGRFFVVLSQHRISTSAQEPRCVCLLTNLGVVVPAWGPVHLWSWQQAHQQRKAEQLKSTRDIKWHILNLHSKRPYKLLSHFPKPPPIFKSRQFVQTHHLDSSQTVQLKVRYNFCNTTAKTCNYTYVTMLTCKHSVFLLWLNVAHTIFFSTH